MHVDVLKKAAVKKVEGADWRRPDSSAPKKFDIFYTTTSLNATMAIINASPRDIAAIDLDRALNRLERKILSADADPRLQHSSYQRIKTSAVSSSLLNHFSQPVDWSLRIAHKDAKQFPIEPRIRPHPPSPSRTRQLNPKDTISQSSRTILTIRPKSAHKTADRSIT